MFKPCFAPLGVAVLLLAMASQALAWDAHSPERLSYTVRWLGISAGSAELYYQPQNAEKTNPSATSYSIYVRAWTGPAVRWAYHVRDRITVTGQHTISLPFSTKKYVLEQVENDHRGDKSLQYKRDELSLVFRNHLNPQEAPRTKPMPNAEVRDLLSILYQLRTELTELTPGKQWTYTMYDLTRPHKLIVTAVAPSTVETPIGTFDAYELALRQEEIGGSKVTEGLRIWVSTGPRKLPLKFEIDIPLGSFTARLEDIGIHPADSPSATVREGYSVPPDNLPLTGPIPALEKTTLERNPADPKSTLANPYQW